MLFFEGGRPQHQVYQVSHHFVRENNPLSVFDELGHLFLQEVTILGCRFVVPTLDAAVLLVVGPRIGFGVDWDAFIPP